VSYHFKSSMTKWHLQDSTTSKASPPTMTTYKVNVCIFLFALFSKCAKLSKVSNIAPTITKDQLNDYFTYVPIPLSAFVTCQQSRTDSVESKNLPFMIMRNLYSVCCRISSLDYDDVGHKATISYEKVTAAKTALMVGAFRSSHFLELTQLQLNGGSLGESTLSITSDDAHPEDDHHHNGDHPIEQSDKPRAGSKLLRTVFFKLSHHTSLVAAEYIAKGYMLSDAILQRAIDMDSKLLCPFSLS